MMRFITGHKLIDKIKISTLRNITSLPARFDKIKSRCLKLFVHVKRSTVGLAKICFEGTFEGKRSRGRPRMRWRNNILLWSNIENWSNINKIVPDWKKLREISHVGSQSALSGGCDSWWSVTRLYSIISSCAEACLDFRECASHDTSASNRNNRLLYDSHIHFRSCDRWTEAVTNLNFSGATRRSIEHHFGKLKTNFIKK